MPAKFHLVKAMVFPVVMYGCEFDYKETWASKNWCFWTVVLEKILRVPWTARWSHGLYSPWNFPGQNTGVGSLSLLQGFFLTQGWNPGLPHCRRFLYQLSHKGTPRILEWVAYPVSSLSSQPRNQTSVFWIGGGFFTNPVDFIRSDQISRSVVSDSLRSRVVKSSHTSLLSPRFSCSVVLWLRQFPHLKKVDCDCFCPCYHCFYGGGGFCRPLFWPFGSASHFPSSLDMKPDECSVNVQPL